ncbi:MAG: hypothetical protein M3214_05575, partial [Actinomycetota bacterium]|nr:hypothetical protein [Actinomycetota bacterium]
AAVAIKEAAEKLQESRQPKKSAVRRFVPSGGLLLAAGGGLAYLAATDRLNGLLNRKSVAGAPRSEAGL